MTIPLNHFVQQIVASGLLSGEDVRTLIDALPAEQRPRDAEQLARLLVRQKKLTAYQAQQIQAGQGRSLVLGNYVILDKLGQGGMGLVLKAEHRRMKRVVALKVLSPQIVRTPELLRRFQREVEAAAKLSHPNIVVAHDADEVGGTHFLVMEYVKGTDLSTLVKQRGPLPIDQALDYIVQAARGLEYAHQHGVIHRDIKPGNLLVESRGLRVRSWNADAATGDPARLSSLDAGPSPLKILDMGLARVQSAGGQQDELTGSGQIMGTVDYMAPEQAANTKRADQRADIYSLGITLWYLLTARPAYPGDSAVEKLMAHQTQPIPSLRSQRPGVSPALDAVFAKMVAKTPNARYQTMTEVIAALESCRGTAPGAGTDLEATLDMSSPQIPTDPQTEASVAALRPDWGRNRRLTLVVSGVLVILLGVWLAVAGWPRGSGWGSLSRNDSTRSNGLKPRTSSDLVTDLNRVAAQWVVSTGGTAKGRNAGGRDFSAQRVDELPVGRLTMTGASWLGSESVDDRGLAAHVSGLQELAQLQLTDCTRVTDAVVPTIITLPRIAHLHVDGTLITDNGVLRLVERGTDECDFVDA